MINDASIEINTHTHTHTHTMYRQIGWWLSYTCHPDSALTGYTMVSIKVRVRVRVRVKG